MTVKEISDVVDRDERTIRNWIYDASKKTEGLLDKMAESTPKKPADFTEAEVFAILRAGMGEKVAAVYMYNAQIAKQVNSPLAFKEDIVKLVTETISSIVPKMFDKFEKYLEKKQIQSTSTYIEDKTIKTPDVTALENRIKTLEKYISDSNNEKYSPSSLIEDFSMDLNSNILKRPYIAFNIWRGKRFVEGIFDTDNEILKENDRVLLRFSKDKITLEKSNRGFLISLREKTRKVTTLRFKHIVSKREELQIPIKLPDEDKKITINGKIENGKYVFYYSDSKVKELGTKSITNEVAK